MRPEPLKILSYLEMKELHEPQWLVEGLIQDNTTALMFGKSNSFKSFLAIDIALSVASQRQWHGHDLMDISEWADGVEPAVLIVATEGGNGVGRKRIPAWYDHHGIPETERTAFLYPKEIRLDVAEDVTALIQAVKYAEFSDPIMGEPVIRLIVIDIFGGSMAGSEIEDKTARAWVHGIQRILRETDAAVLVVAHAPYQDDSRIRGHSHFWGSFDTRLKVEGDKDAMTATLTVERHKDADSSGSWGFRLVPSGGSLVPELDAALTSKAPRKAVLSAKNRAALNALDDALTACGVRKLGADWPSCNVVAIDEWRRHFYLHSADDTAEAKRKAFQRARDTLREHGHVQFYDDHVWRCFDAA